MTLLLPAISSDRTICPGDAVADGILYAGVVRAVDTYGDKLHLYGRERPLWAYPFQRITWAEWERLQRPFRPEPGVRFATSHMHLHGEIVSVTGGTADVILTDGRRWKLPTSVMRHYSLPIVADATALEVAS